MRSKRLYIKKYGNNDFEYSNQLVTNLDVMQRILGRTMNEEESIHRFQEMIRVNDMVEDLGYYKIFQEVDRAYIGLGKLTLMDDGVAELGYTFLPNYWGKGYGTELSLKLVEYAKEHDMVKSLVAYVDPENEPSIKILVKSGFVFDKFEQWNGLDSANYKLDF